MRKISKKVTAFNYLKGQEEKKKICFMSLLKNY